MKHRAAAKTKPTICTGDLSFLCCNAQSAKPEMMNGKAGMDLKATREGNPDVQANRDTAPIKNVAKPLARLISCMLRIKIGSEEAVISEKPSGIGG